MAALEKKQSITKNSLKGLTMKKKKTPRSTETGESVSATLESISGETTLNIKGRSFSLANSSQSSVLVNLNKSGGVDYTVKAYADSVKEAVETAWSAFIDLDARSEAWLKKVSKRK